MSPTPKKGGVLMYDMNDFWEEFCFFLSGVIIGGGCLATPPTPPGIPWWMVVVLSLPLLGCGIIAHIWGEWEKERLREKRSLKG
jgi:hypothetical protein